MTLVKIGRRAAVFRVAITTAAGTTTHLVLAADQALAASRAAKAAGLDRSRGRLIREMQIERLTEKLPPIGAAAAMREIEGKDSR
jgi:hypothetical protein